jgi:hypothetical protein
MCFSSIFRDDFWIHSFLIREVIKSQEGTSIGEHAGSHQPTIDVGVQQHGTI